MTEKIHYNAGGQELIGFFAAPDYISGKLPGILVVHEWTGLNTYAKKRAEDLASLGYIAFALDMYGDGKEVPQSEARTQAMSVGGNHPLIKERFNAALEVLKSRKGVNTEKIAAIGYCFGGGIVLNMARMGTEINGVVAFHPSLNTGLNAGSGDVKTRILALQGDGDPAAPEAARQAFTAEMDGAGADYEYVVYPNLPAHNFTNPEGATYHEAEADDAWKRMRAFFTELF